MYTAAEKARNIGVFWCVHRKKRMYTHVHTCPKMYTPAPKCTHLPLLRIKYMACERSLFEMQMAKNSVFSAFFACLMCGTCCWSVCVHRTMHTPVLKCTQHPKMYTATAFSSPVCTLVCTLCTCVYMLKK